MAKIDDVKEIVLIGWESDMKAKVKVEKFISSLNLSNFCNKFSSKKTFSNTQAQKEIEVISKLEVDIKNNVIKKAKNEISDFIKVVEDRTNRTIETKAIKAIKAIKTVEAKYISAKIKFENEDKLHTVKKEDLYIHLNTIMLNDDDCNNNANYIMELLQPSTAKYLGITVPSKKDLDLTKLYAKATGKVFSRMDATEKSEYMTKMNKKYSSEINIALETNELTPDLDNTTTSPELAQEFVALVLKEIVQEKIALNVRNILNDIEEINAIAYVERPLLSKVTIKDFRKDLEADDHNSASSVMTRLSTILSKDSDAHNFKSSKEQEIDHLNDLKTNFFTAEKTPVEEISIATEELPIQELLKQENKKGI